LLGQHLDSLQRLDLTLLQTAEPNLAYFFKHALTQDAAYNLMLYAQRRSLHAVVASWYEHVYADDLSPYYPLLAHHWRQAEVPAKTAEYLERSGEQALARGAYKEARDCFAVLIEHHDAGSFAYPVYNMPLRVYMEVWAELAAPGGPGVTREVRTAAQQAYRHLKSCAALFPLGRPALCLWQGMRYWLNGKPRAARASWRKGLAMAQRYALPYEDGLIHAYAARYTMGEERAHHIAQMTSIFERIGAIGELELARANVFKRS